MNIQPSTLKELLQLQLLSKMSLLTSSDSSGNAEDDSNFSELLNSLLSSSSVPGKLAAGDEAALNMSASKSLKPGYTPAWAAGYALGQPRMKPSPSGLGSIIERASERHGVEQSLVKAVIDAESSFNPNAVSRAGAKGLMQLMDGTSRGLGVTNPLDPEQNVQGGTRYLSDLLEKYNGNRAVALAAYNAGPGRVDRLGIKTDQDLKAKLHLLPNETQAYVGKVLRLERQYEA